MSKSVKQASEVQAALMLYQQADQHDACEAQLSTDE